MDISSILGIIVGAVVIVWGIGFGSLGNFWDPNSLAIVLGGTIAAVIASYPLKTLKQMFKHTKILISGNKFRPEEAIDKLVEMAQLARKNGLLALEEQANELEDPFFKQGILLVVDAMDEEKVRAMLEQEIDNMAERHDASAEIYDKAAAFAPAFGMIGTLVGLINMLKGMDLSSGSSSSIGEDMSVALITTFYGCVIANLIFMPIAKKLRIRNDEELLYKQIILEGVIGIQEGDNPKNLKEKLVSHLSEQHKAQILNEDGEEGAEGDGKKKKKKGKKGKEE